jgi:hypothetical protein
MIKPILAAAALSILVPSAAWAVPAALPSPQVGAHSSDLLKVGKGDRDRDRYKKRYGKKDWNRRRGHAYRHPDRFRGWNRYSYRPYDWRDRGCVSFGPFWYCTPI